MAINSNLNEPLTRGQPPKRGQKLCSQSVLYSEVPLYREFSTTILTSANNYCSELHKSQKQLLLISVSPGGNVHSDVIPWLSHQAMYLSMEEGSITSGIIMSWLDHRLKRKGLATKHPRKYHPCFAPVLIEAYFQRGS